MKYVVCGGRKAREWEPVFAELDRIHAVAPITMLIEGGQRSYDEHNNPVGGIDYFAHWWAKSRGVPHETVKADWYKYGRSAGPKRNTRMLVEWKPDGVVAFPGGSGTADMVVQARGAGVPVIYAALDMHAEHT